MRAALPPKTLQEMNMSSFRYSSLLTVSALFFALGSTLASAQNGKLNLRVSPKQAYVFVDDRAISEASKHPSLTLRFDSEPEGGAVSVPSDGQSYGSVLAREAVKRSSYVTISAGTRISVRTLDAIDSAKNHVGDRFQASLEEPLILDDSVAAKGADVYGRLEESNWNGVCRYRTGELIA